MNLLKSVLQRTIKVVRILQHRSSTTAMLRHGVGASVEHRAILRRLRPDVVVDIGANRGQFALAVREASPQARITSFEPLTSPGELYRRVFAGDPLTVLHPYAIGSARGSAVIHISSRDDSSSLLPITSLQNQLFPGTAEASTQTIQVAPLADFVSPSDLIGEVNLLKLDVQGFELQALQGCEGLISHFDHVYVECSFVELYQGQSLADDVIRWLQAHGFMLAGVQNMSYDNDGLPIQGDFLFSRRTAS